MLRWSEFEVGPVDDLQIKGVRSQQVVWSGDVVMSLGRPWWRGSSAAR
jgi:hypothetical protein